MRCLCNRFMKRMFIFGSILSVPNFIFNSLSIIKYPFYFRICSPDSRKISSFWLENQPHFIKVFCIYFDRRELFQILRLFKYLFCNISTFSTSNFQYIISNQYSYCFPPPEGYTWNSLLLYVFMAFDRMPFSRMMRSARLWLTGFPDLRFNSWVIFLPPYVFRDAL